MTDIVYIIGDGSGWNNNELRYSLRSVHKFLNGFGRVFIVGHKPHFVKDIIHIPLADMHGTNKNWNIMEKIKMAFSLKGPEDIFVMHDDHFLLQHFNAGRFPYYKNFMNLVAKLRSLKPSEGYRIAIANTWTVLDRDKKPVENFNIHCPAVFKKKEFLEIMDKYQWNVTYGFLIKSLYCNHLNLDGPQIGDMKINKQLPKDVILAMLESRPFFSIGEGAYGPGLAAAMEALFPDPSPWEA